MANQWNGAIATQTVHFRGVSTVSVKLSRVEWPQVRAVAGAAYAVNVVGGVSGGFGVQVHGFIGGTTYVLAGVTNITAAGKYVLYPIGYSSSGAAGNAGDIQASVDSIHRLDQIVPPSHVAFVGGTAAAGISASCTVSAVMWAAR